MALSKFEYNSFDVTPVASNAFAFNSTPNGLSAGAPGAMTLISTSTVSSGVSAVSITSGINSTYDTYMFKFINIHPSADFAILQVNFSTDGGSNYSMREFISGDVNTTSDIDAVQFSVNSGTIDSGVIKMYGLSKS